MLFNLIINMDSNDNQNTKIWEKPWSIDEIKNSAGLWSLAADSGVNKYKILITLS